jgi:hypothetical protein
VLQAAGVLRFGCLLLGWLVERPAAMKNSNLFVTSCIEVLEVSVSAIFSNAPALQDEPLHFAQHTGDRHTGFHTHLKVEKDNGK